MREARIAGAVLIVLTLTLAGAACGGSPEEESLTDGGGPVLHATTLSGDSVSLADLRGQAVLLNVWATWCVPCRKEAPELEAVHEAQSRNGLRVVGVTVDNRGAEEQIRQFVEKYGITYDIWWDPDGAAIEELGAVGVPLTVLIDRDGHVAWRHLGVFDSEDAALRNVLRSTL